MNALCFQIAVFTQGAQFLDDFWTEERICFVLTVTRDNLLNHTLSSLVSVDDMELKKPLRVSYNIYSVVLRCPYVIQKKPKNYSDDLVPDLACTI